MTSCVPSPDHPKTPPLSTWSLSVPVAMGYVPLGAVFGFLFVQAGAPWWIPPLASLLVFAGAAQFMVIPMLAAGAPLVSIIVATAVVNLRHIFYGLSLLDKLPPNQLSRAYLIWALTDENYSVITTVPPTATSKQIVGVVMLNHCWWVLGALLGAAAGAKVSHTIAGLDFSLTALFAVLAVEQWRATERIVPIVTAVIAYATAWAIIPSQALVIAIGLSLLMGIMPLSVTTKGAE